MQKSCTEISISDLGEQKVVFYDYRVFRVTNNSCTDLYLFGTWDSLGIYSSLISIQEKRDLIKSKSWSSLPSERKRNGNGEVSQPARFKVGVSLFAGVKRANTPVNISPPAIFDCIDGHPFHYSCRDHHPPTHLQPHQTSPRVRFNACASLFLGFETSIYRLIFIF